jgi:hypothetical protein
MLTPPFVLGVETDEVIQLVTRSGASILGVPVTAPSSGPWTETPATGGVISNTDPTATGLQFGANTASGANAVAIGGNGNTANGANGACVGGQGNVTPSDHSACISGMGNSCVGHTGEFCAGGQNNTCGGFFASCIGGANNTCSGDYTTCVGGGGNTAGNGPAIYCGCFAGQNNQATLDHCFCGGGLGNSATGDASAVVGGQSAVAYLDTSIAEAGGLSVAANATNAAQSARLVMRTTLAAGGTSATFVYDNSAELAVPVQNGKAYTFESIATFWDPVGGNAMSASTVATVKVFGGNVTVSAQAAVFPAQGDATLTSAFTSLGWVVRGNQLFLAANFTGVQPTFFASARVTITEIGATI